jgi:hypothetical protein
MRRMSKGRRNKKRERDINIQYKTEGKKIQKKETEDKNYLRSV